MIQLLRKRGKLLEQSLVENAIDCLIDAWVVVAVYYWLFEAGMVVPV